MKGEVENIASNSFSSFMNYFLFNFSSVLIECIFFFTCRSVPRFNGFKLVIFPKFFFYFFYQPMEVWCFPEFQRRGYPQHCYRLSKLCFRTEGHLHFQRRWKTWERKNYLMQCFQSLSSSDGSMVTFFFSFSFFWSLWETAIEVKLFRTQGEYCWVS